MIKRFRPAMAPLAFLLCLVSFVGAARAYRAGDGSLFFLVFCVLLLLFTAWNLLCAVQRHRVRRSEANAGRSAAN
ncbi:hypothetical protein [Streptomyces sp. NPDC060198]|uniref:hypothetical protein n=1 Tax=Streptomyces sp. NPDC060198 TaxID=3347070 RepID=UPI003654A91B